MTAVIAPSGDLYPGSTVFPGMPLPVDVGGYKQLIEASIGDLILTATDPATRVDWLLSSLDGWWGSPGSTLSLTQKPRSPGGWPGPRQLTARTLTAAGTLQAPNLAAMLTAHDRLNSAASLDASLLTVADGSLTRSCIVYRQDVVLLSPISATESAFSVQFTAPDPRKFAAAVIGTTRLPTSSGGLTYPTKVPYTIRSQVELGLVQLSNPGNINGPVVLRIDGPCGGPVITHVGSGLSMVFSTDLVLGAGEWLEVDMEARTALANGQSSRNSYITSRGWSSFEPGGNTWAFSAESFDSAAQLTVTATPAWQ